MAPIVTSVEIARSPEDVFAFLTDVPRKPEWQDGLLSVSIPIPGTVAVGARVIQQRRVGSKTVTTTAEVAQYEPPHVVAYRGIDGPMRTTATQRVEPSGKGSRVSFETEVEASGFDRIVLPLARKQVAYQAAASLERLKQILESGDA